MNPTQTPPKLVLKMGTQQLLTVEDMLNEFPIRYQNQVRTILDYMDQFVTEEATPTPTADEQSID